MKLKVVVVIVLLAVGAGATVVALGGLPGGAAASSFLTQPVSRGTVTQDTAATGSVEPSETYGLAFGSAPRLLGSDDASDPASGRTWEVAEVEVAAGDRVEAAQVLARADTTELETEIADAERSVQVAGEQLEIAQEAYEEAETSDDRQRTRIDVLTARNAWSQARRTLRGLRDELRGATLRAPIAGVVGSVDIAPGVDAPSSDAIVVHAAAFVVEADVVESDLPDVSPGQPASVTIEALEIELEGSVATIGSEPADEESGVVSYPVTITIADPPADLRTGMTAEIAITLEEAADVLTIPARALLGSEGDYMVRVPGADGSPELRPVTVGLVTNTLVEVTDGLAENELVITGTSADQNSTNTIQGPGGAIPIPGGGVIRDVGPRGQQGPTQP
jgi:macrolide-specific efflux system membrane fusion protein